LFVAAVLIAIVGGYFGIHWFIYRLSHSITDDAFVESHIINIAPQQVSGHIVRILVEENDRVTKGDVLAEIDAVPYRDQVRLAESKVEAARAELKRQEASLARLRKEVPLQIDVAQRVLFGARADLGKAEHSLRQNTDSVEKSIEEARASLEAAEAEDVLAKQEYDRFTSLYKEDAVPQRRSQQVTMKYNASRAEVRLAAARLAKAESDRTKIKVSESDVEAANAAGQKAAKNLELAETGDLQIREMELLTDVKKESVEEARRALELAQNTLAYTAVRAPFPGIIVKRFRNLGDYASPGVAVLSMYNSDLLYVTANLEETRLPGVAPGNLVELRIDAFPEPFRGRVVWINKSTGAQFALMPRNVVSGEFTKVVQRVPVRIQIDKDDRWEQLRAGLSVAASITHGSGDPAWAKQAAREMAELETRYNLAGKH
jgi:membrane fusion protein, multidrug efflux system